MPPTEPDDFDSFIERGLSAAFELEPGESAVVPAKPVEGSVAAEDDDVLPAEVAGHPVSGLCGRGGSGIVLRAEDHRLGRPLAIKILRRRFRDDAQLVARFETEARVSARLEHPGVVPVHEIGHLEDGRPFFTMALIEGETLAERLAKSASGTRERIALLDVFRKVCETVAYAHSRGVVHRDLKPRNLMIGAFGEVLVMDWGFALETVDGPVGAAADARIVGTPSYMAPEQARGEAVTARSDVFSLGGILCEILTGAPPFAGETTSEVLLAASRGWTDEAHQRLQQSGTDQALVAIVERCLAPDPAERFADAGRVADEIKTYLHDLEERSRRQELELVEARTRAGEERRARKLTTALAVAVLVAMALGVAGWLTLKAREREHDREVGVALQRAALHFGEAQASGGDRPEDWRRAQEAASWARDLATRHFDADSDAVRRADDLHRQASERLRSTTLDLAIQRRLRSIRGHFGDFRSIKRRCREYEKAFRDHGIDLRNASIEDAVSFIKNSRVRHALVVGLDDWLRLAAHSTSKTEIPVERLLSVANRVDENPWCREIREALTRRDRDALVALAQSEEARSASADALMLFGASLTTLKAPAEARAAMQRAHVLRPDDGWLNHDLAVLLREVDDESAIFHFGMAAARLSDNEHVLVDLAQVLLKVGKNERAQHYLDRALKLAPEDAAAWHYVGMLRVQRDEHASALEAFERALASDSGFWSAREGKAMVLRLMGRREEALSYLEGLREQGILTRHGRLQLASLLLENGDLEAAETAFVAATKTDSRPSPAWRGLGQIYGRTLRWRESAEAYERALSGDPQSPEILCELGNSLIFVGRLDEGLAKLEEGDRIGRARQAPWPWPSQRWIEQAREVCRLRDDIVAGRAKELPEDSRDALDLGRVAALIGKNELAWQWFSELFGDFEDLAASRLVPHRLLGVRAGMLAKPGDASRRAEVLDWLERDLETISRAPEASDAEILRGVLGVTRFWLTEPAFAPLREEDPGFAATEAAKWKAFWTEVRELSAELEQALADLD